MSVKLASPLPCPAAGRVFPKSPSARGRLVTRWAAVVLMSALAAGCNRAPEQGHVNEPTPQPESPVPSLPSGWQEQNVPGAFTIALPPGWRTIAPTERYPLNATDPVTGLAVSVEAVDADTRTAAGAMHLANAQMSGLEDFKPPRFVTLPVGTVAVTLGGGRVGNVRLRVLKYFVPSSPRSFVVNFVGATEVSASAIPSIMETFRVAGVDSGGEVPVNPPGFSASAP